MRSEIKMKEIETLFFELVRTAIGTQKMLSRLPDQTGWDEMMKMAVKQSLVGICFAGLHNLGADSDEGFARIGMSEDLYFTWMGMAANIQMRNEVVNKQCIALQKQLSADGIRSSILKGQAVGLLYDELALLRQSGDIDLYVNCGREKALKYAQSFQDEVNWDYKHMHLKIYNDTEVEIHYVPEISLNLFKNARLQKWFSSVEVQESIF